jgi:hypothetical protein
MTMKQDFVEGFVHKESQTCLHDPAERFADNLAQAPHYNRGGNSGELRARTEIWGKV